MPEQLVVTAIGENRTGMVGELTRLVSEAHCNIIDSRIAILGSEFSFIMLLSGEQAAINRFEFQLPQKSAELGLLTMMKRTGPPSEVTLDKGYILEYQGNDQAGVLSRVTTFLAENEIDIACLQADTFLESGTVMMRSKLELNVPDTQNEAVFIEAIEQLCSTLDIEYTIQPKFINQQSG